jgi:hypothetical protein
VRFSAVPVSVVSAHLSIALQLCVGTSVPFPPTIPASRTKMKAVLGSILVLLLAVAAAAATTSDQDFVVVGNAELEAAIAHAPTLDVPTILMEVGSVADGELDAGTEHELQAEVGLVSPILLKENARIEQNQNELAKVELLAHELGVPVLSDILSDKAEHDVEMVEHSLIAAESQAQHESEMESAVEHVSDLDSEHIPVNHMADSSAIHTEAETSVDEAVEFVELSSELSAAPARSKLDPKNDYAYLDDPKFGGSPTKLKNLKGLDIYVVNTPLNAAIAGDNENEIRPVKPPHPMNAEMREKARLAALMKKQLIHDIPEPKAAIRPRTKINTMSAYEPSLQDQSGLKGAKSLRKLDKIAGEPLADPIVGGHGGVQLKAFLKKARRARFAQVGMESAAEASAEAELPGTGLPGFPRKEPRAAKEQRPVVAVQDSSFDNRDGPPRLLDDLLPLKAQLVEDLDPLGVKPGAIESKPNGW